MRACTSKNHGTFILSAKNISFKLIFVRVDFDLIQMCYQWNVHVYDHET